MFEWTHKYQDTIKLFKTCFTTAPTLAHLDACQNHILKTDTSDDAVGVVLLQRGDNNVLQPVRLIFCTMSSAKHNYAIFNKEMLAIFWAFTKWRPMLLLCQKTITTITNHKAILHAMSTKVLNWCQAHWAEFLAQFDFEMHYRPGEENGQANALSCWENVCATTSEGSSSFTANYPNNVKLLLQPQHLQGQCSTNWMSFLATLGRCKSSILLYKPLYRRLFRPTRAPITQ